jgi:hypothetical protein
MELWRKRERGFETDKRSDRQKGRKKGRMKQRHYLGSGR